MRAGRARRPEATFDEQLTRGGSWCRHTADVRFEICVHDCNLHVSASLSFKFYLCAFSFCKSIVRFFYCGRNSFYFEKNHQYPQSTQRGMRSTHSGRGILTKG